MDLVHKGERFLAESTVHVKKKKKKKKKKKIPLIIGAPPKKKTYSTFEWEGGFRP